MIMHRLLFKWTVHGKSPSITTDPSTIQNDSKLLDLVIRTNCYRHICSLMRFIVMSVH